MMEILKGKILVTTKHDPLTNPDSVAVYTKVKGTNIDIK